MGMYGDRGLLQLLEPLRIARVRHGLVAAIVAAPLATFVIIACYLLAEGRSFFQEPDWFPQLLTLAAQAIPVTLILLALIGIPVAGRLIQRGRAGAFYFAVIGGFFGAALQAFYQSLSPEQLMTRAIQVEPQSGLHAFIPGLDDFSGTVFWLAVWACSGACSFLAYWLVLCHGLVEHHRSH